MGTRQGADPAVHSGVVPAQPNHTGFAFLKARAGRVSPIPPVPITAPAHRGLFPGFSRSSPLPRSAQGERGGVSRVPRPPQPCAARTRRDSGPATEGTAMSRGSLPDVSGPGCLMQRGAWAFPSCQRAETSPELRVGWERHRPGGSPQPWVSRMAAAAAELWASWQVPTQTTSSRAPKLFGAGRAQVQVSPAPCLPPVSRLTQNNRESSRNKPLHPCPPLPRIAAQSHSARVMQPERGTGISPRWRIPQISLAAPETSTPLPRAVGAAGQGCPGEGRSPLSPSAADGQSRG